MSPTFISNSDGGGESVIGGSAIIGCGFVNSVAGIVVSFC